MAGVHHTHPLALLADVWLLTAFHGPVFISYSSTPWLWQCAGFGGGRVVNFLQSSWYGVCFGFC